MCLLVAGLDIEVDGLTVLVGCRIVVGYHLVDTAVVDRDSLHTDGTTQCIKSHHALRNEQQPVPVARLIVADGRARHGVLVVPLTQGIIQWCAELVFQEVVLTIVDKAQKSVH